MATAISSSTLRIALPKGRMNEGVVALLRDAGIRLNTSARGYRPTISVPDSEVKLLKPQNVVEMLDTGSRDLGFAGADWVAELQANVVEILDTQLDPVRLVAAAPNLLAQNDWRHKTSLLVASEYQTLTRRWMEGTLKEARFVRSYGATEVFPPEDADIIVDNTATGSTLRANGLAIIDEVMRSSTRLYASPGALENPSKRQRIDDLALLVQAVLQARSRVLVEVNVAADQLDGVLRLLPCMRQPTVAQLAGGEGYAVRAAVPRSELPRVIPQLKANGGSDVIVSRPEQIVE